MAQTGKAPDKERAERALKMTLAGIIGQVGCLTLIIIGIALGAGLWLDSQFDTRPLFALILVLASVPVTLYLMFRIVLSVAPKLQMSAEESVQSREKEKPDRDEFEADKDET